MSKTVKELADELGVSKQRIQQVVSKLPASSKPKKQRGQYIIGTQSEKAIRASVSAKKSIGKQQFDGQFADNGKQTGDKLFLEMKDRIKNQTEEIKQKNMQLEKMQKLLDQSQQLQLMAEHKLKRLETTENEPESDSEPPDNQIHERTSETPPAPKTSSERHPRFWEKWFEPRK